MNAVKHRVCAGLLLGLGALSMDAAVAGNCADPWVTQAVTEVLRRPPASALAPECNIKLYNNGRWGSYKELRLAVGSYWATNAYPQTSAQGQATKPGGTQGLAGKAQPNRNQISADQVRPHQGNNKLISDDGSTLIGNDGGSLVGRRK